MLIFFHQNSILFIRTINELTQNNSFQSESQNSLIYSWTSLQIPKSKAFKRWNSTQLSIPTESAKRTSQTHIKQRGGPNYGRLNWKLWWRNQETFRINSVISLHRNGHWISRCGCKACRRVQRHPVLNSKSQRRPLKNNSIGRHFERLQGEFAARHFDVII